MSERRRHRFTEAWQRMRTAATAREALGETNAEVVAKAWNAYLEGVPIYMQYIWTAAQNLNVPGNNGRRYDVAVRRTRTQSGTALHEVVSVSAGDRPVLSYEAERRTGQGPVISNASFGKDGTSPLPGRGRVRETKAPRGSRIRLSEGFSSFGRPLSGPRVTGRSPGRR